MKYPFSDTIRSKLLLIVSAILFGLAGLFPLSLSGQEFPCDGSFYFVSTNTVQGSKLFKLVMNEDTHKFTYEELPLDNPTGRHITAIGYNVQGQMIYGLDFDTYELLRLGSDGSLVSLGVVENLDQSYEYHSGDISPDGNGLRIIARSKTTGFDERIYSIRINNTNDYRAGYFSTISELPTAISDITTDPIVGVSYGFDLVNKQIVIVNFTGQVTHATVRQFDNLSEEYGSLFFDRRGQMYGLGNTGGTGGEQNIIYMLSKNDGSSIQLETAAGGRDTDGCVCPYTIEFTKTITPQQTFNCGLVTIEYNVINKAGIGQIATHIYDVLPPEFNILDLEIENNSLVNVNSGVGTNEMDISRWTLVLADNKIKLTAKVNAATPGIYESQATIENFPPALNFEFDSDDPTTGEQIDPTALEILEPNDIRLIDYVVPSCDLDTSFLTIPVDGEFLWSDGSTETVLAVTEAGEYGVTVTNECFVFEDQAFIEMETEDLFVELGDDLNTELGDRVGLAYTTNAKSVTLHEWQVEGDVILDCTNCPNPKFVASGPARISLTIIDERGCMTTDELNLSVDETRKLHIPNAFSPNEDGVNDFFFIQGRAEQVLSLQIYDRWGRLLFDQSSHDPNSAELGWDGSFKGERVDSGIYLWIAEIEFANGEVELRSGDLLLIR